MAANLKAAGMQDDPEIHVLSINSIIIRPDLLQTREKLDPAIVALYAQWTRAGDPFPPVLVYQDPISKEYWLADGFHRVEARLKAGRKYASSVRAIIRVGTITDALLDGIAANLDKTNIRKVTDEDRLTAVRKMICNGAGEPDKGTWGWSNSEIGRRCHVSPAVVQKLRVRLTENGVPIPDRVKKFNPDGSPTGTSTRYKYRPGGVRAIKSRKNGDFTAKVGGKEIYLGRDASSAAQKLQSLEGDEVIPSNPLSARKWLLGMKIPVRGIDVSECFLGGSLVGDVILLVVPASGFDGLLREIGRAVLLRARLAGDARRVVLVKSVFDASTIEGRLIALAKLLPDPIEFMTPKEVVAEFGPKDGELVRRSAADIPPATPEHLAHLLQAMDEEADTPALD